MVCHQLGPSQMATAKPPLPGRLNEIKSEPSDQQATEGFRISLGLDVCQIACKSVSESLSAAYAALHQVCVHGAQAPQQAENG